MASSLINQRRSGLATECDEGALKCTKDLPIPGLKVKDCLHVGPSCVQPRVVIIGGGIAGLSAAQKLKECGFNNFVVLESNSRPGGRVYSCWMGDTVIEVGAQWIDGGSVGNSVYTLANSEGLLNQPIDRRVDKHSAQTVFFTSDGRAIKPQRSTYLVFDRIKKQAKALFGSPGGHKKGNLMHFFTIRLQQEVLRYPEELRYDAERILCGLANEIRCRWGEDLANMSAWQFGSFREMGGGLVRIPSGLRGITAPILRSLPAENIKFKKKVDCIRWGEDLIPAMGARAVVKCCDGDQYCADYVIVTLPLGVLKKYADDLFSPYLPEEKRESIEKLGFGNVTKVFLEYGAPWWSEGKADMRLAWSMEELADRGDWKKGLSSIEEAPGSKHVVFFTVGGPEALFLENCPEDEIAAEITKLLRTFTGDPTIPYPCNVLKSGWSRDDNFLGSVSFTAVGSGVGHRKDLGSPVPGLCDSRPPILLFGGEATSEMFFSTVHGARLTGLREAERLLSLVKLYNGPPPPPKEISFSPTCPIQS